MNNRTIRFTNKDAPFFAPERSNLSALAAAAKAREASFKRILIADDDALVRGSLAAVLESEGFLVDEAQNGAEAVMRAAQSSPDLILLDLNMPKMEGWTAFTEIDQIRPLVPVIVITARPNQYPEAFRHGVDAFMEKPLDLPVLLKAIRKLTNEPGKRCSRRITARNSTWLLQAGR
jgi:two-component system, chemotaxis family, chemotaxis protein CheY